MTSGWKWWTATSTNTGLLILLGTYSKTLGFDLELRIRVSTVGFSSSWGSYGSFPKSYLDHIWTDALAVSSKTFFPHSTLSLDIQNPPNTWWAGVWNLEPFKKPSQEMFGGSNTYSYIWHVFGWGVLAWFPQTVLHWPYTTGFRPRSHCWICRGDLLSKTAFVTFQNINKRNVTSYKSSWKAKCPIFMAIVAGLRGKVA